MLGNGSVIKTALRAVLITLPFYEGDSQNVITYSKPAEKIALVFDWGNTLMKVFPEYSGPMVNWPEVAEVEGMGEALDGLAGRFPMVVATNAANSTAELVWEALRRAKLDLYFKAVFTSHELGSKKPSIPFFRALESVLDHPAHQCVMIGDDYSVDVLGAKAAGWRAVWFNPGFIAAPALLPLHDAEIHGMESLQSALARLSLPDYAACLNWLVARGTPYNILNHIQLVASIAYQLAVWLNEKGETVDPVLTHRGAMLHDLAKIELDWPGERARTARRPCRHGARFAAGARAARAGGDRRPSYALSGPSRSAPPHHLGTASDPLRR